MPNFLLDSSAVIALIRNEQGSGIIEKNLELSSISAVNLAEVFTKLIRYGVPLDQARTHATKTVKSIIPFDTDIATLTGELASKTSHLGLSLGDRACIATAIYLNLEILTTDQEWGKVELPVKIHQIR